MTRLITIRWAEGPNGVQEESAFAERDSALGEVVGGEFDLTLSPGTMRMKFFRIRPAT
jgi:hypothetical protein